MNDGIEQYPAEKKRIKGDDLPKPDLPVSGAPSGSDIEPFPAVKQRMKPDDLSDMIFFDVDEESEEADFIRVDDLFRLEGTSETAGPFFLTMFPKGADRIISEKTSRLIRRSLYLSAVRLGCSVSKVRVRPRFIQWFTEPAGDDDPEKLAREFRADLEFQMNNLCGLKNGERFWAGSCFMWSADSRVDDEKIRDMIELYREK